MAREINSVCASTSKTHIACTQCKLTACVQRTLIVCLINNEMTHEAQRGQVDCDSIGASLHGRTQQRAYSQPRECVRAEANKFAPLASNG